MAQAKYDKLNSSNSSIRILHLLPGRWADDLCCEVQTVSLDDKPAFDALSYAWGNANDTSPIEVDRSCFHATKNLTCALRRLRSSIDPKVLWVDAICINQADTQEKADQVALMAKIYKAAGSVHIFLGESGVLDLIPQDEQASWADPPRFTWCRDYTYLLQTETAPTSTGGDSRGVLQDMSAFMASPTPEQPGYDPVDTTELPMWVVWEPTEGLNATDQERVNDFLARQQEEQAAGNGDVTSLSPLQIMRNNQAGAFAIMKILSNGRCLKTCLRTSADSAVWKGALEVMDHIVKLPWWTRVWVLQEAILNQGNVLAIYGEIVAPIGLIEGSGAILTRHYERGTCCKPFWNSMPLNQQQILQRFSEKMGLLETVRENVIRLDQADRLLFLLESTRFKDATDPRDKIYGLLGLLHDSPNPIDLAPDYTVSVTQLYVSLASLFIDRYHHLGILLNDEPRHANSSIPSWVPRWGRTYSTLTTTMLDYRLSQFNAWPPTYGPFPALATDHATSLSVLAKPVTRITSTTKPMIKGEVGFCELLSAIDSFFHLDLDPFADYLPAPTTPLSIAVTRTMMGDLFSQLDYAFKVGRVTFDRAYEGDANMFRTAQAALKAGPGGLILIGPDQMVFSEEDMAHIIHVAEENFWYANEGRVFFEAEGGYIGSAPPGTEAGDEVCLVFGSPVPLVLREIPVPVEATVREGVIWRQVVGHTYVHGIMDGEAAPGHGRDGSETSPYEAKAGTDGIRSVYLI